MQRTLRWSVAVILSLLIGLSACAWSGAAEIHVSTRGADTNSGTVSLPVATLARARDVARASGRLGKEPVAIVLHEGTHYLPQTLMLTAEDSGSADAPVTWQAAPGEVAVISGGERLTPDWTPHKDGIMKAAVRKGLQTDQLFVNGRRQILARYPNYNPQVLVYNGFAADAISKERAARWADPAGGFAHIMHGARWGGYHYFITGKNPDGTVAMEGGWQNNRGGPIHKEHRFVENIFEELDAPGEWFLDRKSDTLYFYPPADVDLKSATVEAVTLRHLVEFKGSEKSPVRFVQFRGVQFRHAQRTFMQNKEPLLMTDWTVYRGGALFFEGAEDCALNDCLIDQVGGNAVFVNGYNRRISIIGSHITQAGANGIAFVGGIDAVREPRAWKEKAKPVKEVDLTPGPKSNNYPAQCLVEDCLIERTGRVEKQTAPVEIDIAQDITVRHCSIYDVPRAGINIGDGCFGGHVVEFCDVFDTVKETGDHGSFNSWGRDRYWNRPGWSIKDLGEDEYRRLATIDVVKPNVLRNNRWKCDHGWDVDLDDGSSNYRIENNLFLHGGLKLREGFGRVAENNITVNNSLHPHVWYEKCGDVVRHNIFMATYQPAIMKHWDGDLNHNFFTTEKTLKEVREKFKTDADSVAGDPMFVDADNGDYRVKEGSPALAAGFKNFPMDQFGVTSKKLKGIARTPIQTGMSRPGIVAAADAKPVSWAGGKVRAILGEGEQSVYGLPEPRGVLVLEAPAGSALAGLGLQPEDVIMTAGNTKVASPADLPEKGMPAVLQIVRKQNQMTIKR